MNKNNDNNNNDIESDLFEFLKYILGCTYISDLRIEPYNTRARLLLKRLKLKKYSLRQLKDIFKYIYTTLK